MPNWCRSNISCKAALMSQVVKESRAYLGLKRAKSDLRSGTAVLSYMTQTQIWPALLRSAVRPASKSSIQRLACLNVARITSWKVPTSCDRSTLSRRSCSQERAITSTFCTRKRLESLLATILWPMRSNWQIKWLRDAPIGAISQCRIFSCRTKLSQSWPKKLCLTTSLETLDLRA